MTYTDQAQKRSDTISDLRKQFDDALGDSNPYWGQKPTPSGTTDAAAADTDYRGRRWDDLKQGIAGTDTLIAEYERRRKRLINDMGGAEAYYGDLDNFLGAGIESELRRGLDEISKL